jgi:hypothetical protein
VANPALLDREATEYILLHVVASDGAPAGSHRSATVPVNVTLLDVNDNQPVFAEQQQATEITIIDNIVFDPEPSPIVQVRAADADAGVNAQLHYSIVAGNEEGRFALDSNSGVVYPNASFLGMTGHAYELTLEVTDEAGRAQWPQPSQVKLKVLVENVNTHKPEWFPEPPPDQTIEIREESEEENVVILKVNKWVISMRGQMLAPFLTQVNARDRDFGENAHVSYFLKSNNENVAETEEFSMDEATGELRAKGRFDREHKSRYELVLVARDHGTPVAFETLRFITVVITDINDNEPKFPRDNAAVRFTVPEEEEPGYLVGQVRAEDPDDGDNGRVFYYIVAGNKGRYFSVDKTYGNIYTKKRIDREQVDSFEIIIKATNDPDFVCNGDECLTQGTNQPSSLFDTSLRTVYYLL